MDSPELRYLKRMSEVNRKFYAHVTVELADLRATLAAFIEMQKVYIIMSGDHPHAAFHQAFQQRLEEYQRAFQEAAKESLRQYDLPNIDTDSENN